MSLVDDIRRKVHAKTSPGHSAFVRHFEDLEELEGLREMYSQAQQEIRELKQELAVARRKLNEAAEIRNTRGREYSTPAIHWLSSHIMFLLKACHPDKHKNSAESNEVTRELIRILKAERE